VQIRLAVLREVCSVKLQGKLSDERCTVVDDEVDSLDVHASAEQVCGDEQAGLVGLEHVVVVDAFLHLEFGVDADRVKELLL